MPIYEYQCDSCSHRFEVKQSMKDDPVSACERCGQSVRRLISSPGIMFKGSGWYVTDYSDKLKPPSGTGTETGGTSTGEKKESTGGKKDSAAAATSTTAASAPAATSAPAAGSSSTTPSGTTTPSSSK